MKNCLLYGLLNDKLAIKKNRMYDISSSNIRKYLITFSYRNKSL